MKCSTNFETSIRNFRGTSRGTPHFPFGTQRRKIWYEFSRFRLQEESRGIEKTLPLFNSAIVPIGFSCKKVDMQIDSRSIRIHFRWSIYAKECSNRPPNLNLLRFDFKGIISVLEIVFVSHCYEAIWVIHQRTCNVFIQLKKENKHNARLSTRKKTKQTPRML